MREFSSSVGLILIYSSRPRYLNSIQRSVSFKSVKMAQQSKPKPAHIFFVYISLFEQNLTVKCYFCHQLKRKRHIDIDCKLLCVPGYKEIQFWIQDGDILYLWFFVSTNSFPVFLFNYF